MIPRFFARPALHEHADAALRIQGVADLPPDSDELVRLIATDPSPEVRAAAAARCTDIGALTTAAQTEPDDAVRSALTAAIATALATTDDAANAHAFLAGDGCSDSLRADVARSAADAERRRVAIAGIRDEDTLVDVALSAAHAETRMAAAERVRSPEGLRKLADAARNRDNGVARHARQRIDAIDARQSEADAADAFIAQLEALAHKPGPILTEVVELNRRWEQLDVSHDPVRLARCEAARQMLQARFDRENEEQRSRARFERRLREWLDALQPPPSSDTLAALRTELDALDADARSCGDEPARAQLEAVRQKTLAWEQDLHALAGAEALVVEAEQLAAGTSIDHAKLPDRWQALDRSIRTPALTRRFEAALMVIEQRRLAQVRVAQQEATATRQRVHAVLHEGEQALAAGQLQPARAAADEIRTLKIAAGVLPKPTLQRIGRLAQQLTELERWESFGQHNARVQLCDRADALAAQTFDSAHLAREVQKLRNEWKTLDAQHAGVPKALWERFDRACEKAYAPAARHFAEQAARRKEARRKREDFIAGIEAHVPTLLAEPRDWRAIERWLRETDQTWRDGDLGSVEPEAWKKQDARLKTALAPLRDALSEAREKAKAGRVALIAEVTALMPRAMERDAPSQVKAIQAKWQEHAKQMSIAQRDERVLWEQFRAACDAVFTARHAKRNEEENRKSEGRRALEEICAALEELARATDKDEQELRRSLRDQQEQWKAHGGTEGAPKGFDAKRRGGAEPAPHGLELRYRNARAGVESAITARARSRENAVWQTLAAKESLCETLDRAALAEASNDDNAAHSVASNEQWAALPALPPAWEKALAGRRDAALHALSDATSLDKHRARIAEAKDPRDEILLELEMTLRLESPADLQPRRLALQVQKLRDRFQDATSASNRAPAERLVAWCAMPGIVETRDRERCARIFKAVEHTR